MKELVKQNTTSKIIQVFLRDSTTGLGKTGVAAASMAGQYSKGNAASVSLSFSTGSVGDSYQSGKWAEIGNGRYYYHAPNALYSSLGEVFATFQSSGAIDAKIEYQIVAFDPDAVAVGANTTTPPTVTQIRTEMDTNSVQFGNIATSLSSQSSALSSIAGGITTLVTGVTLATSQPNYAPAKAGDAMALTSGERNAVRSGLATSTNVTDATTTITSAIAALNDLDSTEAQAAAAAALTAFGVPTYTQIVARSLPTADYATSANLAAAKTILDRFNTMIVLDGSVYQFTANALELGPSGGGGGASDQAIISGVLAGLGATTVEIVSPYDNETQELELNERDDYVVANGRGIRFNLSDAFPEGDTILFGATRRDSPRIDGEGTVDDDADGRFVLIELTTEELERLPGEWRYSLTHVNSTGKRHTFVNSIMTLKAVQTAGGGA